jgi:hypothetical protein
MFDCIPMIFYIITVIILILISIHRSNNSNTTIKNNNKLEIMWVMSSLLCSIIGACILYLFCSTGNKLGAWIIALLPIIVGIFRIFTNSKAYQ